MGRLKREESETVRLFASRLTELVEQRSREKGLSMKAMAEAMGFSNSTLHDWLTCSKTPSIEAISIICGYFKVSADYLLGTSSDTPQARLTAAASALGLSLQSCLQLASLSSSAPELRRTIDNILSSEHLSDLLATVTVERGNAKALAAQISAIMPADTNAERYVQMSNLQGQAETADYYLFRALRSMEPALKEAAGIDMLNDAIENKRLELSEAVSEKSRQQSKEMGQ